MGFTRTLAILLLGVSFAPSCKRRATSEHGARGAQPVASAALLREQVEALRDGDLIFHESRSNQSEMVRALTGSRWTHMGVVFKEAGGAVVLEAASPVRRTRFDKWVARGRNREYVVKRLRDAEARLGPAPLTRMRSLSASWLGRPYDLRFRWDDQSLYCSELAYKLFDRAVGVQLGKLQTARDMNLDDELVQRALRQRFGNAQFDPDELVVTPDSIFNDARLVQVEP